jgi:hypothetical protein
MQLVIDLDRVLDQLPQPSKSDPQLAPPFALVIAMYRLSERLRMQCERMGYHGPEPDASGSVITAEGVRICASQTLGRSTSSIHYRYARRTQKPEPTRVLPTTPSLLRHP